MSAVIRPATDATFDTYVGASALPVLVVFSAKWCGPCKAMEPAILAFAERHAERLTTLKVDIEDAPLTARNFAVRSVPTLMVLKDGRVQITLIGSLTDAQLTAALSKHL